MYINHINDFFIIFNNPITYKDPKGKQNWKRINRVWKKIDCTGFNMLRFRDSIIIS